MKKVIFLTFIITIYGCTIKNETYQTKIINEVFENRKTEWLENQMDDNILYLHFLGGFNDDKITVHYYNTTVTEEKVTTDESQGLATTILLNKNVDTIIQIRKSNGPILEFNPMKFDSNYWGIYFLNDTLFGLTFKYAPTFE